MKRVTKFSIRYVRRLQRTDIFFNFGATSFGFLLPRKYWRNLLSYLRKTKNRSALPRDALQYAEFDIDKNHIVYRHTPKWYRNWINQFFHPKLGPDEINRLLPKGARTIEKEVRKNIIARRIGLRTRNLMIWMNRKQFKKFRDFCISHETDMEII